MAEKIQTNDVFVLFMAGHGKALNGQYHFLPYEVIFRNQDAFVKGCLSHVEIDNFLRSMGGVFLLNKYGRDKRL